MRTLFAGATVIDGRGGVLERQGVVVDGAVIESVGLNGAGSREFDNVHDLGGRVLMPGLIDTHLHFGGGDFDPSHAGEPVGVASLRSAEAAARSLRAGFTTIRSAGAPHHLDVDCRDAVGSGIVAGPRILASGRGITHTGGHMHEDAIIADGVDEIRKAVRALVARGVDSIKLFGVSAGVATAGADVGSAGYSVEEIAAAVAEGRKFGKLDQVHSISLAATRNAISAGVRSIDHGIFLDEEACQAMKQNGIMLVPTFGPFYYYTQRRQAEPWRIARAESLGEAGAASFRMAMELGVTIAVGSDLGAPSRMKNGENALELTQMWRAGMRADRVLVAATSTSARLLQLDDRIGSIEPGKLADLIVVDENPLDDVSVLERSVSLVMRDGVVYRDDHARLPAADA